jgi:hypothetical protein
VMAAHARRQAGEDWQPVLARAESAHAVCFGGGAEFFRRRYAVELAAFDARQ